MVNVLNPQRNKEKRQYGDFQSQIPPGIFIASRRAPNFIFFLQGGLQRILPSIAQLPWPPGQQDQHRMHPSFMSCLNFTDIGRSLICGQCSGGNKPANCSSSTRNTVSALIVTAQPGTLRCLRPCRPLWTKRAQLQLGPGLERHLWLPPGPSDLHQEHLVRRSEHLRHPRHSLPRNRAQPRETRRHDSAVRRRLFAQLHQRDGAHDEGIH